MMSTSSASVDVLVFAQPGTEPAAVLSSFLAIRHPAPPLSDAAQPPPVTFPAPFTFSIPFAPPPSVDDPSPSVYEYSACLTDLFPLPPLPKLEFRSLLFLHLASASSTLALDDARRHLLSLVRDRPALPVLGLLVVALPSGCGEMEGCTAEASVGSVDLEDLALGLECDKLPNPFNVVSYALRSSTSREDAASAMRWLHNLLQPSPLKWSSSTSFASLLSQYMPSDLAAVTLSYLTRQTRGTFLTAAEWQAQQAHAAHAQRLQLQRQHRKELLRFLSAYTQHSAMDDSVFLPTFLSSPASFMFPNSSFAHLDCVRLLWVSMREEGLSRGSQLGWERLESILKDDRSKRLLGHWAQQRRHPAVVPGARGRPLEFGEWQRERALRERDDRMHRRIMNVTRWACIAQFLADLIVHSHSTHPQHHRSALLSSEDEADVADVLSAVEGRGESAREDGLPMCFPSFTSFLSNHPSLLTLSFVEFFYSPERLDDGLSWVSLVPSDRAALTYWLPPFRTLLQAS